MMQEYTPEMSGTITHSATNPLDEIPVGPQQFPFGDPQSVQSDVEAYAASNYQTTPTSFSTQLPTTTDYQTQFQDVSTYQSNEYPTTNYATSSSVQYTQPVQEVNYNVTETPTTSVSTQYQTVTRYKPVTKTVYVPKTVTTYTQGSGVQGGFNLLPLPPVVPGEHFVSNYPIYENDPRRRKI